MEEFQFTDMLQELGSAHTLLDYCEGNQRLAFAVVDAFFDRDIWHAPTVCVIHDLSEEIHRARCAARLLQETAGLQAQRHEWAA